MRNDLISRETAIAEITSWIFTDEDLEGEGDEYQYFNRGLKRAIKALAKVPAVDAVEVVRCKDCEEYIPWLYGEKICGLVGSYHGNTKPDDYCSRGRKMIKNDLISREALLDSFRKRCMEDCGYCPFVIYNPEKPEIVCGLIRKAPAVDVKQTSEYEDLYDKYLMLANTVNEQLPEIMKLLTDYKENMPRFKEEYNALLHRFQHLMQSKFIASFDTYDPKTHTYKRDIAEADRAEPVRHSRWKYFHKQNRAVCIACSFERDLDADFGRAVSCPNCGAKMDGGVEDVDN